jgi:hypothetical protein
MSDSLSFSPSPEIPSGKMQVLKALSTVLRFYNFAASFSTFRFMSMLSS